MYKCELCYVILQKRNKTKHDQSKKHKYYSNLLRNRYVMKDVEVTTFKDVFDPYFIEHTIKFNFFTVYRILRLYDNENYHGHEINAPNYSTYNIQSKHYSIALLKYFPK